MKFNFLRKIGILLLAIAAIHFTCYFPVVSASSSMEDMTHSKTMITDESFGCCEESAGVCHDVGDLSFLNFVAFEIWDNSFIRFINTDLKLSEKNVKFLNISFFPDSQLEKIKTVQIVV